MENVNVTILQASGKLLPFLELIQSTASSYMPILDRELSLQNIDVVICDDAGRAIPETGMGGMAYNQNLVLVYINPDFPNLGKVIESELKSTLAHELNHIARWQEVGYGLTLLEALVSEGLADHFDQDLNNGQPKPWDKALTESDLLRYIDKAKLVWNDKEYNHSEWFFGAGNIPRWAGYSIGYKLVGDHIKSLPSADYKELVNTPAEEFVK